MPVDDPWRIMVKRTAVAAAVMGLIGSVILALLTALPAYRDLWLILVGVLGTGAVGVWRGEIDSETREARWRREVNLRRLDDTQGYVFQQVTYLYARSTAAVSGQPWPAMPLSPLYTEVNLAGDVEALVAWHQITGVLQRATAPMSVEAGRELASAAARLSGAIQAQRARLWRKERPSILTAEQEATVQSAVDGSFLRMGDRVAP